MSTRCHILFSDKKTSLLTFKHSDGYPEGVIPLLREFWKWYPRTEDLEYLTATWFYYCKRQTEEKFCKPQSEEKFKNVDWYDAPMATDELNHNHPVVLSYGVCADGQIHGDTEHFYEVDIENETVTHYTPESWGFLDADSPADIVSQEPKEIYQLRVSNPSNGQTNSENPTDSQIASDGGTECSQRQDTTHQGSCERCGSTEGTNWVVQAGTPAGEDLNLTDEESVELCDACMQEIAEATQTNVNAPVVRFSRAMAGKSFDQIDEPQELVRRTEDIFDKINCEVRTDFDDAGGLLFVDIADRECINSVEKVFDELEWYSSFYYRESEDDFSDYEASYVCEFIDHIPQTTKGDEDD